MDLVGDLEAIFLYSWSIVAKKIRWSDFARDLAGYVEANFLY
jgi:NADH:ubiquinone oxidoreductase subunit 3 (subunit A)